MDSKLHTLVVFSIHLDLILIKSKENIPTISAAFNLCTNTGNPHLTSYTWASCADLWGSDHNSPYEQWDTGPSLVVNQFKFSQLKNFPIKENDCDLTREHDSLANIQYVSPAQTWNMMHNVPSEYTVCLISCYNVCYEMVNLEFGLSVQTSII